MSEDKKNATASTTDKQTIPDSTKNVQTAPVLKTHEIFTYNGNKMEKEDN